MRATLIALSLWATCSGQSGEQEWESEYVEVEATAYCPCSKCTDGDGKTSTGRSAYRDGVAVDPKRIRLGSRIDVPGIDKGCNGNGSWLPCDDTGRLIEGAKIDVRFQDHKEAKEWGRKKLKVRVWRKR